MYTQNYRSIIKNSKFRWPMLFIAAGAMMIVYLFMDLLTPLKHVIQNEYGWTNQDWGTLSSASGYINIFLFFLLVGGVLSDILGIKKSAITASIIILVGATIEYLAFSIVAPGNYSTFSFLGISSQIFYGALGFALFCAGAEMAGITVVKVIVKWFSGNMLATAIGIEGAISRMGSAFALFLSPRLASGYDSVSGVVLTGVILLVVAAILFIILGNTQKRAVKIETTRKDDIRILKKSIPGIIMVLIACIFLYSSIFPFYYYAPELMIKKYNFEPQALDIIGILPAFTGLLAVAFALIYDFIGKGNILLIIGSSLILIAHTIFWFPSLDSSQFFYLAFILLGIGYSAISATLWVTLFKLTPYRFLGTTSAVAFYLQNIGLIVAPIILAKMYDSGNNGSLQSEYSSFWIVFIIFSIVSLLSIITLKIFNKKYNYGIDTPNLIRNRG